MKLTLKTILAAGLAGQLVLACAEPKPKPDTKAKADRAHDELEQEEEQMKERKNQSDRSAIESPVHLAATHEEGRLSGV